MKSNIISLIVTFGGLGNIKYFPGTVGSLAGLFWEYLLFIHSTIVYLLLVFLFSP